MNKRLQLLALAMSALVITACTTDQVAFRADDRVRIESPTDGSVVTLPIVARWTHHLAVVPPPTDLKADTNATDGMYFAVFVDRTPIAPGESLLSEVDPICKSAGYSCVNTQYFERNNIFLTDQSELKVTALGLAAKHHPELTIHTVNIVLMQGNRRVGEAVYTAEFRAHE
jgi:hypothetical protein